MSDRIRAAYDKTCRVLLEHKTPDGYWTGRLSDSALSTATTVSAFCVFLQSVHAGSPHQLATGELQQLQSLIPKATRWLCEHQNPDGGWGDTDKSFSNISTTLLVKSALVLATGNPQSADNYREPVTMPLETVPLDAVPLEVMQKADGYIQKTGGVEAIKKRYGKDQTFSVPILTNAALAGLADWKDIPQLPFELAALPMSWFRFVKMNVVSYAIPALVAIGQVKFHFAPEKGKPVRNYVRRFTKKRTLQLIQEMQPASGGYLEAAPLTSFVLMSLSAMGLCEHPIVTKGIRFLLDTVREDGSWPIDTNLATWLTSLSISALQDGYQDSQTINWLLSCQHKQRHPFTGASPGGWGWTNLSGAVPDADDTSAALLALTPLKLSSPGDSMLIADGIEWLLGLQNRDGGMPTFCRGWGMLPFDKSSTDITAHALRAFHAWRNKLEGYDDLKQKMHHAESRMFGFLQRTQQPNGSWFPLWFGNQFMPHETNPFYGTAKVLLALAETKRAETKLDDAKLDDAMTRGGLQYLLSHQNRDGGWGRADSMETSSVEETAVVVEALSAMMCNTAFLGSMSPTVALSYQRGLTWLLDTVESGSFTQAVPIGLYFAKLWYYEDLYPIIFTASALRRAICNDAAGDDAAGDKDTVTGIKMDVFSRR